MYKLSLAHFYPKLLNLYGDFGNFVALKKRCEWRGISLTIRNIDIADSFKPDEFDLGFMAGGQDLQQIAVSKELQKNKNILLEAAEKNMVFFAVNGGYQLIGESFQVENGEIYSGAGLLDIYTIIGKERFTGNVTARINFANPCELVGFENHSSLTYLKPGTASLAEIIIGKGNNGQDGSEGARKRNIFGTYLHGALLPKNPHFADYLIELALEKKYGEKIQLKKLNDDVEMKAHKILVGKKY